MAHRLLDSQFVRFCAVGASGYAVNFAVYATLLLAGLHYLAAAAIAFLVAAASNFLFNRTWTFETSGAPVLGQATRALARLCTLARREPALPPRSRCRRRGASRRAGDAILLATPFSFVANKLWAFAESAPQPKPVRRSQLRPLAAVEALSSALCGGRRRSLRCGRLRRASARGRDVRAYAARLELQPPTDFPR